MKTIVHVYRKETYWPIWVTVVACVVMMFCLYGCSQTKNHYRILTDAEFESEEDQTRDLTATKGDADAMATDEDHVYPSLKAYFDSGYLQRLANLMQTYAFDLKIAYISESELVVDVMAKNNSETSYNEIKSMTQENDSFVKSIAEMIKTEIERKTNVKDVKIRCLFWDFNDNKIAEKTY